MFKYHRLKHWQLANAAAFRLLVWCPMFTVHRCHYASTRNSFQPHLHGRGIVQKVEPHAPPKGVTAPVRGDSVVQGPMAFANQESVKDMNTWSAGGFLRPYYVRERAPLMS